MNRMLKAQRGFSLFKRNLLVVHVSCDVKLGKNYS